MKDVPKIRVGRRGVIVIPKDIREKLGIREGMVLDLEVDDNKIIIYTCDLWSRLRERGKKIKIDLEEAEKELTEAEEEWLKRFNV